MTAITASVGMRFGFLIDLRALKITIFVFLRKTLSVERRSN